jgi:hypothetical protein
MVRAGIDKKHRVIDAHLVVPSQDTSVMRIIRYEPKVSRELIDMGYADAQRTLAGKVGG